MFGEEKMIRNKNSCAALVLAGVLCIMQTSFLTKEPGRDWEAHLTGPIVNGQILSTEEPYYIYQWALKNNGNLQLSPNPGVPGQTAWSQAGVDINVEPAGRI